MKLLFFSRAVCSSVFLCTFVEDRMYLGITRLYAVLHGTFVISCLEKISDSYETCDFPFSCFCRIDFRIVPPADRDAAIRYRGDGYRSGTRRNTLSLPVCLYLDRQCRRSSGMQAIQESNMLYFFGLEHFQGGVQEAVDLSIGQFMDEYIGTLDESVPQWETEMEMAVESEARVWIRCWSIRFRVRTIRAVRTVCTASIAIIIPLRAVMSWLCPTCSMRHDRRL